MKIQKHTKEVLERATPKWLEKLCAVNFDGQNLELDDFDNLRNDFKTCMIGELHDFSNNYYNVEGDPCESCTGFCYEIPHIMGIEGNDPDPPIAKEVREILDRLAKHIEEIHPDHMNKKLIPNECET